jgi:hypothetical protein
MHSFTTRKLGVIIAGIILLTCPSFTIAGPQRFDPDSPGLHKLTPALKHSVSQMRDEQSLRVIVRFSSQSQDTGTEETDSSPLRRHAIKRWMRQMQAHEGKLKDHLKRAGRSPLRAKGYEQSRSYWIAGSMGMTVTPKELEIIASLPNVLDIADNEVLWVPPVTAQDLGTAPARSSLWNLNAIGLNRVGAASASGAGIRIGVIDTGITPSHPEFGNRLQAWKEFGSRGETIISSPHETHSAGHGTHVASVAAGASTGVAPGAQLYVALALPGGFGSLEQVMAAMQWMADPDGNPATDDGPQIVNMSWGLTGTSTVLQQAVDNLLAAGILPVGAIGNLGASYSMSPANVPGATGVGAVDRYDSIASFSGGGTVCWSNLCLTKPDVSAPGVEITGVGPSGQYQLLSGTSLAAPHVAGAAALLLEHASWLTLLQLKPVMSKTAKDLGNPGPDDRYGSGRLDVGRAFDYLDRYASRVGAADLVLERSISIKGASWLSYACYFSDSESGFFESSSGLTLSAEGVQSIGIADVDGDGYSDLVLKRTRTNGTSNQQIDYLVFRSADLSGFGRTAETWCSLTASGSDAESVIGMGDVNGDGRADLVSFRKTRLDSVYSRYDVYVRPATSGKSFANPPEAWGSFIFYDQYTATFGLGDVNGDGKQDLIRGTYYSGSPSLYYYVSLSDGHQFNSSPTPPIVINASFNGPLRFIGTGDVNGDGRDDLVFSSQVLNFPAQVPVYVSLAYKDGFLLSPQRWAALTLEAGGAVETIGDLDGDGAVDLVVKKSASQPMRSFWLSDGSRQFYESSFQWPDAALQASNLSVKIMGAGEVGLGSWR